MRILVTGGKGQLGKWLVRILKEGKSEIGKIPEEYKNADVVKHTIDTGAVIITGETARKENARDVLQTLSGFAGDFVVATAGPDLESIISGKGAGAAEYSKEHKRGCS